MDNPYASQMIIDAAKKSMPDVLFRQEYLAEFVDDAAIFENIEELACMKTHKPDHTQEYWVGIDIALKDDYTVITVMNAEDEVVYFDRFNQCTAPQLKARVIKVNDDWQPQTIMIEANNQGLPIIDDLEIEHGLNNIERFQTTATSKQRIVNNLINAFSSKKIKVPNVDIYKSELETFTMIIGATGKPKFEAASGFHDDIVMSLAIAWENLNENKFTGNYNFN